MLYKFWKNYRFPIILFISIIIGSLIGLILGDNTSYLEPIGNIFINMLFVVVVPLVFFSISSSIASINSISKLGKIFKYMLFVFIITSLISSVFMLLILLFINPVSTSISFTDYSEQTINIGNNIVNMFTTSEFYLLLSKSNIFPLIIFSIIFGLSVKLCGDSVSSIKNGLESITKIMYKMVNIIMYLAPIGLMAYFANLIGTYGPELIGSYAKSFIIYLVVALLYYVIFYSLYVYLAYRKKGIKLFYKNILLSTITSLGTCSSLASLPANITVADNMNIDKEVSRFSLPIGATIHMEGSSMASILKIVFLFSIFGRSFTGVSDILIALLIAVLSGVVMSGIPGGGLIGEMLIVSMYGFPSVAFPIISTIGWLVDSPATCLNVVGDIPSAMMLNRLIEK